jgi:hypothetical protein
MRRAYRTLLRLYPRDYRELFAAEMLTTFEKAAAEHRRQGLHVFVRFALAESIGLIIGAVTEWIAKLATNSSVRGVGQNSLSDEVIEAQRRITFLVSSTVHAIANHDFPGARSYSYQEREARENLRLVRAKYKTDE